MKPRFTLLIFILYLFSFSLLSQDDNLKIGEWKHYFAFNDCFTIVETPTRIIGASGLGLNIFTKTDQSLSTITKINGLSDYNLTAVSYISDYNLLAIGYSNGNIDLMVNGSIYNINDLKIKQMNGSKRINSFFSLGSTIYCCTDFGVILINIDKKEVSSTWYIGDEGLPQKVYQLAANGDNLYVATENGLKKTSLTNTNPAFFENWETISPTNNSYCSIVLFSGQLICALGEKGQNCSVQKINNDQFTTITSVQPFYNIVNDGDELMIISGSALHIYSSSFELVNSISSPVLNDKTFLPSFRYGVIDEDDNIWIADINKGLLKRISDNTFLSYNFQGPAGNKCRQLLMAGSNLWTVAGDVTDTWGNAGIKASCSVLTSTGWQHITNDNTMAFEDVNDLIGISENPLNSNNVYINSWGYGVFELEEQSEGFYVKGHFNNSATGLQMNSSGNVNVGATAFDKNNTFFMTNADVDNGLVAYFSNDESFLQLSYQSLKNSSVLGKIVTTSSGNNWMNVGRGNSKGLFVWNDNDTPGDQSDDKYRSAISSSKESDSRNVGQLLLWDDSGEEITRNIYSIAQDQNGYIWIGTDVGVVVQYQPGSILTKAVPVFSRIKIARSDGSGLADYLLNNVTISSIAVDAANRKWIGTKGSGVFLVSADGTNTISSLNSDNSALPSDSISSIVINDETGEVIIATQSGIVAVRGAATEGEDNFSSMYAFPNPVRPGFTGDITITGLMTDTNVKITDVAGKLVYETTSVGGQAFWDGYNLWGEKVKSGIYIIFVASDDGSLSGVTKIAIIR